MAKYPFLSDDWVAAAKGIYEAHAGEGPKLPMTLRANLNITLSCNSSMAETGNPWQGVC